MKFYNSEVYSFFYTQLKLRYITPVPPSEHSYFIYYNMFKYYSLAYLREFSLLVKQLRVVTILMGVYFLILRHIRSNLRFDGESDNDT